MQDELLVVDVGCQVAHLYGNQHDAEAAAPRACTWFIGGARRDVLDWGVAVESARNTVGVVERNLPAKDSDFVVTGDDRDWWTQFERVGERR